MPVIYVRTNLGVCGRNGCDCCWVNMRVCAGCLRGPLNDSDTSCGECPESPEPQSEVDYDNWAQNQAAEQLIDDQIKSEASPEGRA